HPLWHLAPSETRSGAVAHPHGNDGQVFMGGYGPTPRRVLTLDGCFIAVDVTAVKEVGLRFDEQFTFHHYDLDFTIQANLKGLTVTTWPIWTVHQSPGLRSYTDPAYIERAERFLNKYAEMGNDRVGHWKKGINELPKD
ncbi:hypothetical protein LCGC14_2575120, partial [marine sediment metagenome]